LKRPHETGDQRGPRGLLQIAGVQAEHRLAGARIEAHAVRLDEQPRAVEHEPHLHQRMPDARVLSLERVERVADLSHRGAGVEQRRRRA